MTLKVATPPPLRPPGAPLTEAERKAAMGKAAADARAIFKGDCATCHVDKARGLLGKELYAAACGICHDSTQRAAFVPDLRGLKQPADLDYWKAIIARGKPHTMMPGLPARRAARCRKCRCLPWRRIWTRRWRLMPRHGKTRSDKSRPAQNSCSGGL